MRRTLLAAGSMLFCASVSGQDPVHTDKDKYKVLLENARVRVLEYRDKPGEKTTQHAHPAFVLYAVGPFKRKVELPDGTLVCGANPRW